MIWIVTIVLVILLNIPFGYWRINVKKFSWQWFLSVHFPIPFIVVMRLGLHLGWGLITYPLLIGAYFFGQQLGAKLNQKWSNHMYVTNWLFYDLARKR